MKETVNVNIASHAFTMDIDAHDTLDNYFKDIEARLPDNDKETLGDIEDRMAEIFHEMTPSPMMVITLAKVNSAIEQMGHPSDFGDRLDGADSTPEDEDTSSSEANDSEPEVRHLYRSVDNRSVAGVCGGLAEFTGGDATAIRLIALLLIIFGGLSIWVYVIMWIVIPNRPSEAYFRRLKNKNNNK